MLSVKHTSPFARKIDRIADELGIDPASLRLPCYRVVRFEHDLDIEDLTDDVIAEAREVHRIHMFNIRTRAAKLSGYGI